MQETWRTWVWFLGQEDPLEEGMATHSSILAWRIPWTEEPSGLQSIGSQRVRHKWSDLACAHLDRIKQRGTEDPRNSTSSLPPLVKSVPEQWFSTQAAHLGTPGSLSEDSGSNVVSRPAASVSPGNLWQEEMQFLSLQLWKGGASHLNFNKPSRWFWFTR